MVYATDTDQGRGRGQGPTLPGHRRAVVPKRGRGTPRAERWKVFARWQTLFRASPRERHWRKGVRFRAQGVEALIRGYRGSRYLPCGIVGRIQRCAGTRGNGRFAGCRGRGVRFSRTQSRSRVLPTAGWDELTVRSVCYFVAAM